MYGQWPFEFPRRVSARLVILHKYNPVEFSIIKSRAMTLSMSLQVIYRSISLTCVLCKVLQHIVASNLTKHLATSNILFELQHEFREHTSW